MGENGSGEAEVSEVRPGHCGSAKEYARKRLEAADGPLSPSELAEEYDCGNEHMGDSLRALVDDGSARRIARGKYASAGDSLATETGDGAEEEGSGPAESATPGEGSSGEDSAGESDDALAPNADEVARQWGVDGADEEAGAAAGGELVEVDRDLREQLADDVDDDAEVVQEEGEPEGEEGDPVDVEVVEEGGDWSIPIPVSQTTLLVLLVVGAVALLYLNGSDGDGELEAEDFTSNDEQSRDSVTLLEG